MVMRLHHLAHIVVLVLDFHAGRAFPIFPVDEIHALLHSLLPLFVEVHIVVAYNI